MSGHYPNSVATDEQKQRINENDLKQKEMVVEVLSGGNVMNDFEIWQECIKRRYINHMTPLTSIRRARCNLMNAGRVEATDQARDGGYGTDTTCWKLKAEAETQGDMFGAVNPGPYSGVN